MRREGVSFRLPVPGENLRFRSILAPRLAGCGTRSLVMRFRAFYFRQFPKNRSVTRISGLLLVVLSESVALFRRLDFAYRLFKPLCAALGAFCTWRLVSPAMEQSGPLAYTIQLRFRCALPFVQFLLPVLTAAVCIGSLSVPLLHSFAIRKVFSPVRPGLCTLVSLWLGRLPSPGMGDGVRDSFYSCSGSPCLGCLQFYN